MKNLLPKADDGGSAVKLLNPKAKKADLLGGAVFLTGVLQNGGQTYIERNSKFSLTILLVG